MATSARPVAPSMRRGEGKGKEASKSRPVEGVGARLELRRALVLLRRHRIARDRSSLPPRPTRRGRESGKSQEKANPWRPGRN